MEERVRVRWASRCSFELSWPRKVRSTAVRRTKHFFVIVVVVVVFVVVVVVVVVVGSSFTHRLFQASKSTGEPGSAAVHW